jgi:exosortase
MTQLLTAVRAIRPIALVFAAPLAVVLWAYGTTLGDAAERWAHDPQYSHGWLVPAFAVLLLWLRRGKLASPALSPSWWGLGILLGAAAVRLGGTYFHFEWLNPLSLLPCLAGLVVLVGGWAYLRWAWPAIAFLFFMIPLPHNLSIQLAAPLQAIATEASTFILQVLGQPALAEGNVILLNEVELGVVEACSGLRMLVVFFALSTAVAILLRKPLWERLLICVSAIPIALLTNILRITVTAILYEYAGKEVGDAVFHDLAGWLMMPLALFFLWVEMKLLGRLLIEAPPAAPALVGQGGPAAPMAPTVQAEKKPERKPSRRRHSRPAVAKPFSRS